MDAQWLLAIMYDEGNGVAPDKAASVRWLRMAAEQGNVSAQLVVADRYLRGDGVRADGAQAVVWYRRAAEQGAADAQVLLAMSYREGSGVPRDMVQAYVWFALAAEGGQGLGARSRDALAESMTPAELVEAEEMLRTRAIDGLVENNMRQESG